MANKAKVKIERGTDNVFADLGLPDPEGHLAKAQLVHAIASAIRTEGMTQVQAARQTGLSQPAVSRLLRGDFSGFSVLRLSSVLNNLGRDVTISVKKSRKREAGRTWVRIV